MNAYDNIINVIAKNPNKRHYKTRRLVQQVNLHISGLRLTALKLRKTWVAKECNRIANDFEKRLGNALQKK